MFSTNKCSPPVKCAVGYQRSHDIIYGTHPQNNICASDNEDLIYCMFYDHLSAHSPLTRGLVDEDD